MANSYEEDVANAAWNVIDDIIWSKNSDIRWFLTMLSDEDDDESRLVRKTLKEYLAYEASAPKD